VNASLYLYEHKSFFSRSFKTPSNLLASISKTLKLNKLQEIAFAIALQRSTKDDLSKKANEYLKQKFTDLLNPYSDIGESNVDRAEQCLTLVRPSIYTGDADISFSLVNFVSLPFSVAKELNFDEVSVETLQLILTELSDFIKSNPSLDTTEFYNRLKKGVYYLLLRTFFPEDFS
jgi:hypothetical protein